MAITDQRLTVLDIINEVRQKVKLNVVTTVNADKDSLLKLKYLNDVIAEVSDYDNWQEDIVTILVTAQASVKNYTISQQLESQASVEAVQNIHEVIFSDKIAAMRLIPLDDLRRIQRNRTTGIPYQWAVNGTDANANPILSVHPLPTSAEAGEVFTVVLYAKPSFLVTADGQTIPPYPGKLLVQGLFTKTILDESDGEPPARYQNEKQIYDEMMYESYNRYNGDSGSTIYFRPARGRR